MPNARRFCFGRSVRQKASQSSRLGSRESNGIDFPATCAAENLPEARQMPRPRADQGGRRPPRWSASIPHICQRTLFFDSIRKRRAHAKCAAFLFCQGSELRRNEAALDRGDGGSSAQKTRKNRVISTKKLFLKNIPRGGLRAAAKHGTLWSDQMNSFRSFKSLFTLHERVFWSASAPHHPPF